MKHTHKIGNGPQIGSESRAKQWYCVFGFVPINGVDIKDLCDNASDYEITTKGSWWNLLLGGFFRFRYVIVKK